MREPVWREAVRRTAATVVALGVIAALTSCSPSLRGTAAQEEFFEDLIGESAVVESVELGHETREDSEGEQSEFSVFTVDIVDDVTTEDFHELLVTLSRELESGNTLDTFDLGRVRFALQPGSNLLELDTFQDWSDPSVAAVADAWVVMHDDFDDFEITVLWRDGMVDAFKPFVQVDLPEGSDWTDAAEASRTLVELGVFNGEYSDVSTSVRLDYDSPTRAFDGPLPAALNFINDPPSESTLDVVEELGALENEGTIAFDFGDAPRGVDLSVTAAVDVSEEALESGGIESTDGWSEVTRVVDILVASGIDFDLAFTTDDRERFAAMESTTCEPHEGDFPFSDELQDYWMEASGKCA